MATTGYLTTDRGSYPTKAILIAGGKGAFAPRVLECPGYEGLLGKGVEYHVRDPALYAGRRVLIVGGGDSAVDWVLNLKGRRRAPRHHPPPRGVPRARPLHALLREAVDSGHVELLTHREVREIHGDACVTASPSSTTEPAKTRPRGGRRPLPHRLQARPGAHRHLGPRTRAQHHQGQPPPRDEPAPRLRRRRHRTYEGKLELIATGFSEAAMAVNHAAREINPKARYNPGHSTNLKVFKDREEAEDAPPRRRGLRWHASCIPPPPHRGITLRQHGVPDPGVK
jgi:ferredoxin/flavodoxin---NADP+ reductase